MEIKLTTQGAFIYLAMAVWIGAGISSVLKQNLLSRILFFIGFVTTVVAWLYRWWDVQHVPMQNLFEVFLTLGMLIWPIWYWTFRYLGVRSFVSDIVLGLIVLVPAGFVFHAEPQRLPPALQSWLFAPHVAMYMFSYVLMAKAAVQAAAVLKLRSLECEQSAYQMVRMAFPLLTLGLLLGSVWGQRAWGDYWGWDPKELWSLATWLVYVGYFHFRYMFGVRHPRINGFWVQAGFLCIIITLLWVNLGRIFAGLHNYAG